MKNDHFPINFMLQSNRINPDCVNPVIRIPALHFREQTCIAGSVIDYCPLYPDLLFQLRT